MELNLTKIAHLYDEGERAWFNVFEFDAIDGSRTTAEVRRDQCDPGKLRQTLLFRGADLPPLDECRDMLKSVVAGEAPELRRASGNGWRFKQNGEVAAYSSFRFVAPREGEGECLPPADSGGVGANIKLMGTLDGWKRLVRVARYSTAMMVALCAAVAAPLLPLLKRQGFGLVVFGPSRAGKSTVQLVAASAVGFGTEEELPTFKATEAGLLDLALMFDGHVLPLNEMGTASGRKEEVAQVLFAATYSLMTGQDKQRHRTWAGRREGGNTFTTLALVSSEFSPSEWAERSGQRLDPGETARMIAVPALFDDAPSVFDMLPGNVDEAAAEAWDRNQFAMLREGLPHHRGVAHREFIERLVADLDGAGDAARESVDYFEAKMLKAHMSPVQRDIVAKFGVLLAGGNLAIDHGILPFHKRELREAIERACRAAIAALPDDESALKKSISKLKDWLLGSSIIDTKRHSPGRLKNMSSADGYAEESDAGRTYVVRGTEFVKRFGKRGASELIGWLDDEGLLRHTKTRTSGPAIAWAESQVMWPDRTRPRSIVIKLPRGLDEFDRVLGSE